ncbi:MAG: hypothetical protein CMF48_02900 [Legionellales bacterium]|nr:hypothetical protein [Legionellales bacterium]|tara:strand:- start:2682 stop:5174 length:2493 start_codon:yes stop_codon:yes gene_type:complete
MNSSLILTATQRLASQYCKNLLDDSKHLFDTILSVSDWVNRQYQLMVSLEILPLYHCLNEYEENKLWESVIRRILPNMDVYDEQQIIHEIKSAHKIISTWDIPVSDIEVYANDQETGFLLEAIDKFKKDCEAQKYISSVDMMRVVIDRYSELPPHLKKMPVRIEGYDRIPPLLKKVFPESIFTVSPKKTDASVSQATFSTYHEEVNSCAHWCQSILDSNNNAKIGIICPNLNVDREKVYNTFVKVVSKNIMTSIGLKKIPAFSISGGVPLHDVPVIDHFHKLAKFLVRGQAQLSDIAELLLSPYFKLGLSQKQVYALIDDLKALREDILKVDDFQRLLSIYNTENNAAVLSAAKSIEYNTFYGFITSVENSLRILGWPGERVLDSQEYQALQEFKKISEFCGCLYDREKVTKSEAIEWLSFALKKIVFQEKSSNVNIHILGLLESSGMRFDYIWVLGLNNLSWPEKPSPNRFLPIAIQKRYETPKSSTELELKIAIEYMRRIESQAPNIIYSSSLEYNQEKCIESSLIDKYQKLDISFLRGEQLSGIKFLERSIDKFISNPGSFLGGPYALKRVVECPYQYHGYRRLGITDDKPKGVYLEPSERGDILHQILAAFWLSVKNHKSLMRISERSLSNLFDRHFSKSIAKYPSLKRFPRYIDQEKIRLWTIFTKLVKYDMQREPFEVIGVEKRIAVDLDNVRLNIVVDRVDKLNSGEIWIIDYKTGSFSPSKWRTENLRDLQLPIYASYLFDSDAISYMVVKPDKVKHVGVCKENFPPSELQAIDLPLQISEWKDSIQTIFETVNSGDISVKPLDQASCLYCSLKPLCRIREV